MRETGIVIKVKGKTAVVRFSRKSACANCGMCAFKKNEMFVKVKLPNTLGANVGDEVAVEMGTGFVLTAAAIVYIIPLAAMAIGIFAFESFSLAVQISFSAAFLVIGFCIAALLDRFFFRKKNGMKPHMVEIIQTESNKEEQKMSELQKLNTESFDELIKSEKLVMVDFWADWCGPCKMLMPFVEEIAAESDGSYLVAKVNVDDNSELCERYSIQSVPTLMFFKNGEQVERISGFRSKQQLAAIIEKLK